MNSSLSDWQGSARAEMPVLERYVYLNTGTAGPLPLRAASALRDALHSEVHEGRGNFAAMAPAQATFERCRALCARLVGSDPEEIALTQHTSDSIGIVLTALDLCAGERVVTTTLEHDAVCVPLGLLRARRGIDLEFVDIGRGELALERLTPEVLAGAKLLVVSHVAFTSGAELPLAEIARRSRAAGVPLLVDGAQTGGARPLDVHELGVDFYTLSGQKWVCGPEGTGALYVRRDWIERLTPSRGSFATTRRHDFRGNNELHTTARRFEVGTMNRPAWCAFEASASWILDDLGLARIWDHSLELAAYARRRVAELPNVEIVTPETTPSQLLSFAPSGLTATRALETVLKLAREQNIVIRSTPTAPIALRASFGFFNTRDEVDKLVTALSHLP